MSLEIDDLRQQRDMQRRLEYRKPLPRDGLLTRRVYAVIPPRVDYKLTPLGASLDRAVCGIWIWLRKRVATVEKARREFDSGGKRSREDAGQIYP